MAHTHRSQLYMLLIITEHVHIFMFVKRALHIRDVHLIYKMLWTYITRNQKLTNWWVQYIMNDSFRPNPFWIIGHGILWKSVMKFVSSGDVGFILTYSEVVCVWYNVVKSNIFIQACSYEIVQLHSYTNQGKNPKENQWFWGVDDISENIVGEQQDTFKRNWCSFYYRFT